VYSKHQFLEGLVVVLMSSDVESIGRDDHVAKIRVWLKSPSDTLSDF
jgi:hypothetical protein